MDRILIVDDEATVGGVMRRTLTHAGYAASHADSARQALALAASHNFALVVVDVKLPDMDGFEFAQAFRQVQPATPVLFVSGYPYDHLIKQAVGFEDEVFLQKPFARSALLGLVHKCLTTRKPRHGLTPAYPLSSWSDSSSSGVINVRTGSRDTAVIR